MLDALIDCLTSDLGGAIAIWAGVLVNLVLVLIIWRTLSANKQAVTVANDSLGLARRSSKAQLRAYLGPELVALQWNGDDDTPWHFTVTLKNFGQTPATGISVERTAGFAEGAFLPSSVENLSAAPHGLILQPGQSVTLYAGNTVVRLVDVAAAIAAGSRHAYMRIRVSYDDCFGERHTLDVTRIAHKTHVPGAMTMADSIPDKCD